MNREQRIKSSEFLKTITRILKVANLKKVQKMQRLSENSTKAAIKRTIDSLELRQF